MTKEELSRLGEISKEVEQIKRELNNVSIVNTKDSVKGSSPHFPYTEHSIKIEGVDYDSYYIKINRIQSRLNRKLDELMDEKDRITEYIYSIDDSLIRQILMYRYVNCLSWNQVAFNIGGANTADSVRMSHDRFLKKQ